MKIENLVSQGNFVIDTDRYTEQVPGTLRVKATSDRSFKVLGSRKYSVRYQSTETTSNYRDVRAWTKRGAVKEAGRRLGLEASVSRLWQVPLKRPLRTEFGDALRRVQDLNVGRTTR